MVLQKYAKRPADLPLKRWRHTTVVALLLPCWLFAQTFQPPRPYGGKDGLKDLVQQEMVFPEMALAEGVKGDVELFFTVEANGEVKRYDVFMPLDPACDAEAIRLARMIRWYPALVNGDPRGAEHTLKIRFDPKRYKKLQQGRTPKPLPPAAAGNELVPASALDTVPQPVIENGLAGLGNYTASHMRYPEEAFKRNIEGKVTMEFVVEPSGSVTNIEAVDPLGGGCNEEATRLIRSMDWMPGVLNGEAVRTVMQVNIFFKLVTRR